MARNLPLESIATRSWLPCSLLALLFIAGCKEKIDTDSKKSESPSASASAISVVSESTKTIEESVDTSIDIDGLMAMRLSDEDLNFGWIRLFDGQSLMGWQASAGTGHQANWRIDDGVIAVDSGDAGFLFTTSRFSDFELTLEYLAKSDTNSGVFLRSKPEPMAVESDCFELNIAPVDNPFPTGSIVGNQRVEPESIGELAPNEWHQLHALCDGDHIRTWVDGKEASNYTDTANRKSGLIGLQFREGNIRFRDIRIRPITYAVLPAKSLSDWQQGRGEDGKVDAVVAKLNEDGGLRLTGGKGQMELLQTLDNFILQSVSTTMAANVNSGIFLRCIPGEAMNGYECQIHHGFRKDRRLPIDSGTGAIFRRQAARAVLSDDLKPARVTAIADGAHFATFVEGVQVVDWTDTRSASANPREGLRLEAGTIQLQGHDPTSDIIVEQLGICPL